MPKRSASAWSSRWPTRESLRRRVQPDNLSRFADRPERRLNVFRSRSERSVGIGIRRHVFTGGPVTINPCPAAAVRLALPEREIAG